MSLMKVIATYAMLYMCVFAQAKEVKSLQSPRQWHVSISGMIVPMALRQLHCVIFRLRPNGHTREMLSSYTKVFTGRELLHRGEENLKSDR